MKAAYVAPVLRELEPREVIRKLLEQLAALERGRDLARRALERGELAVALELLAPTDDDG